MGADDVDDSHWRAAGERIQALIAACAADGAAAQTRAEQLVREVVDLYGAGLTRVMATMANKKSSPTSPLIRAFRLLAGNGFMPGF